MIALDSDILIDLFNGNQGAVGKIRKIEEKYGFIFVTTSNIFEILRGMRHHRSNITFLHHFFNNLNILGFGVKESLKASEIAGTLDKKGEFVGIGDVLIAGTLLSYQISKIVTRNKSHFEKCGLKVEVY